MANELQITQDGSHTVLSEKFGVTYHSKYGAIQESMHVFIEAGFRDFLNAIDDNPVDISILEIGFGTGLNAFLTLLETIDPVRNLNIKYTSLEKYPLTAEKISQLNYPSMIEKGQDRLFSEIHDCDWELYQQINPHFHLKKLNQSLESFLPDEQFNLIYFDAFAPESQPELWEPSIFQKMYDGLYEGGILTTYCAKGQVKRNMKSVGFVVEGIPGPPGKREMTRARKLQPLKQN